MKKYDLIIPLGSFCVASESLRRINLQCESYPFDWLKGVELPIGTKIVKENFATFLHRDNLIKQEGISGLHDVYEDRTNGIVSSHDFLSSEDFATASISVAKKYQRRINRMNMRIKEARKILIVHCTTNKVSVEEITLQYQELQAAFPGKDLGLAFVCIDEQDLPNKVTNLTTEITLFNLYNLRSEDFKKCSYEVSEIMKQYRIGYLLMLKRMLPNLMFKLKKPLLKIIAKLAVNKVQKAKIRAIYKDRY